MDGIDLTERHPLHLIGLSFCNIFSWRTSIESIAKSGAMILGSLLCLRSYLFPEAIYPYKFTIHPCTGYCCHIWACSPMACLTLLDYIQCCIRNAIGPDLFSKLDSLPHRHHVTSLSLLYVYFHRLCSAKLSSLIPLLRTYQWTTRLASSFHEYIVQPPKAYVNCCLLTSV